MNKDVKVPQPRFRSLRSIAAELEAHRTSVRRWLTAAGIHPVAFGGGPKGAIRYDAVEVERWLARRPRVQ